MTQFIKCTELSQEFYKREVAPLLEEHYGALKHDAGLIGAGSEVLGYDDQRSSDHDWRPRTFVFLSEKDARDVGDDMEAMLDKKLPKEFRGFATNAEGTKDTRSRMVHSLSSFLREYIGADVKNLNSADWLILPEHKLLTLVEGAVFHAGLGELPAMRKTLSYYPRDVWLYLLASQWQRLSQEEHFMGRIGDVGDDIGSRIIAAKLVRDIMRLCFLMEKRYAPYSKWFGTAFKGLASGKKLYPVLQSVLEAATWQEREKHLAAAYEHVATMHNNLGITPPLVAKASPFFSRPYLVIQAGNFAAAIQKTIADATLRGLPLIGAIEQWVDCTDIQEQPPLSKKLIDIYQPSDSPQKNAPENK